MVYAWVYDSGTGLENPEIMGMKASLGYITGHVAYPIETDRFTWVDASFNSPFICSSNECNNHEYKAAFPTSKAGTFNFIFRFSKDGGLTWAYCDKGLNFVTLENTKPGVAVIR